MDLPVVPAEGECKLGNATSQLSNEEIHGIDYAKGIDLSKHVFVVYGVDEHERVVLKQTLKRNEVLPFFAGLTRCLVGMEAGSGAHYWARELKKLGHDERIMDPRRGAPYRSQGRTGDQAQRRGKVARPLRMQGA